MGFFKGRLNKVCFWVVGKLLNVILFSSHILNGDKAPTKKMDLSLIFNEKSIILVFKIKLLYYATQISVKLDGSAVGLLYVGSNGRGTRNR